MSERANGGRQEWVDFKDVMDEATSKNVDLMRFQRCGVNPLVYQYLFQSPRVSTPFTMTVEKKRVRKWEFDDFRVYCALSPK